LATTKKDATATLSKQEQNEILRLTRIELEKGTSPKKAVSIAAEKAAETKARDIRCQEICKAAQIIVTAAVKAGATLDDVRRVFRHVDDNLTIRFAGNHHVGSGSAADARATFADFAALSIDRFKVGTDEFSCSKGSGTKIRNAAYASAKLDDVKYVINSWVILARDERLHEVVKCRINGSWVTLASIVSQLAKR
jgi:hypothetical protein